MSGNNVDEPDTAPVAAGCCDLLQQTSVSSAAAARWWNEGNGRRLAGRREVRFRRSPAAGKDLAVDRVGAALLGALAKNGFWLAIDDERGNARICGNRGSLDPRLLTDVWFADGVVEIECRLRLLVAEEQQAEALQLALWLTACDGRVAYLIDAGGTPFLRSCLYLTEDSREIAAEMILGVLETVMERAQFADGLFRRHQRTADIASAIMQESEAQARLPWTDEARPWSSSTPAGTSWTRIDELSPELPAGFEAPGGYTNNEFRAMMTVFKACADANLDPKGKGGLLDGCAGPVLIHADGVVECYGCDQPHDVPHLGGTTVSCASGLQLGHGHTCDRCEVLPT
jgi:hypothetical protein